MKIGPFKIKRVHEFLIERLIQVTAWTSIVTIVLIFLFVGKESIPLFTHPEVKQEANMSKLFVPQQYSPDKPPKSVWQPVSTVPKYSLYPLMVGTLKATLIAILFSVPIAIAAALYTAEFASSRAREIIKPTIELLASVPSVVIGFFALIVLASILQTVFNLDYRLNGINAGIALGLAIIPVIYTISEDALISVPRTYKEASLALGATPWQTAFKVVLPAAFPGIAAAVILGFGRAFGETMIVLMASGNAAIGNWDFTESLRTLSATIATELAEVVHGSAHYHVLFFIGVFLFAITFGINFLGSLFIARFKSKLSGARS